MPELFSPLTVRNLTVRNRVWVAPLCQYSVKDRDGVPTDWHLVHLGSFARGGAGLVMTEATAVVADGRISPEDTGIYTDEQRDAWARIVNFIHSQGAAAGIQLAHAGRKASVWPEWGYDSHGSLAVEDGGWETVGPSAVAFDGYTAPRALGVEELPDLVVAFAAAAQRSVEAGFDLVEVHAAHGYLLHEFLSPLSNVREDAYGGSLENRARLLLEIVRAVRATVGEELPIFVRFSASDWTDGGVTPEEIAIVSAWAREAGADLFDISSGGVVGGVTIPVGPGYQVPFAEQIRETSNVTVSAVGLITEAHQANAIIESGQADAVMLGREMMRDPNFAQHAARDLGVEIDYWPSQYLRAKPR